LVATTSGFFLKRTVTTTIKQATTTSIADPAEAPMMENILAAFSDSLANSSLTPFEGGDCFAGMLLVGAFAIGAIS